MLVESGKFYDYYDLIESILCFSLYIFTVAAATVLIYIYFILYNFVTLICIESNQLGNTDYDFTFIASLSLIFKSFIIFLALIVSCIISFRHRSK
jgi:hypothetical protein